MKLDRNVPLVTITEMGGMRTAMSGREIRRVQMMGLVAEGKRGLGTAAEVLGVSYRQAKRIYRRYREEGPAGVVHRNVGRRSHRSHSKEPRATVVGKYREAYRDFGPPLAAAQRAELEAQRERLEARRQRLKKGGGGGSGGAAAPGA